VGFHLRVPDIKHAKVLKGKKIKKKEIRKNVSLRPHVTGGGSLSTAVYQVSTRLDLDVIALLNS
jgi:hypothetical protein